MKTFEPRTAALLARMADDVRAGWQPGLSCRLPARTAVARVLRIRTLVLRGMLEPSRAVQAARAATWEARS